MELQLLASMDILLEIPESFNYELSTPTATNTLFIYVSDPWYVLVLCTSSRIISTSSSFVRN